MCEENMNEKYKQIVEKMQQIANEFANNFYMDNVFPQMKAVLDSMPSLTIFPLSEKTIAFIEEAKASENLSHEDFLDKYGEEIDICKEVGQAGWVVSEHSNPRKIKEWHQLMAQRREKEIVDYFDADNGHTLKAIRNNLSLCYVEAHSRRYYNKGFEQHLSQEFLKTNSFFTKRFLFLNMYPSLIGYLNRLFVDGAYTFESKKEPPYINRNWLLHGNVQEI